jgi:tRNA threonylcarbamoyladenosine biosynthesis protein TsaB
MSKILSIDASSSGCSVALFEDNVLLSSSEIIVERSAAEYFTILIEQVLGNAKTSMSELDAIAVAKGPGSYTGLRIAVSTAKGLCFVLNKPLISYTTLEGMVQQVLLKENFDLLCPMLDARRMEVYSAFYHAKTKENSIEISADIIDENSYFDLLENNRILFFGEGSKKCQSILIHKNAYFLESEIRPQASFSGSIIFNKFKIKLFEDLISFEPFYLKEYLFKTKKP